MNYEKILEIEKWFSPRFISKEEKDLNIFFTKHVPTFWRDLTLFDVIGIAKLSKMAAYTAYNYNYSNFKDFCDNLWEGKIIDYRKYKGITLDHFRTIQRMFDVNTVISPGYMPRNILGHIHNGKHFIFYTCAAQYNGLPLLRPQRPMMHSANVTINGTHNSLMTDPTIEIFYTFSRVNKLELNSIHFSNETISALYAVSFRKLILNDCTINTNYNIN